MRIHIKSFFIATLLLGGGLVAMGPPLSSFSHPSEKTIFMTLPQEALNLSDLDVRDVRNRRMKSTVARNKMRRLFVSGLHELLMMNLTPVRRHTLSLLNQVWKNATRGFSAAFQSLQLKADAFFKVVKQTKPDRQCLSRLIAPRLIPSYDVPSDHNNFLYLLSHILSSIQILR